MIVPIQINIQIFKNRLTNLINSYFALYSLKKANIEYDIDDRFFRVIMDYKVGKKDCNLVYTVTSDYFNRRLTNHQYIYYKALIETLDADIRKNLR